MEEKTIEDLYPHLFEHKQARDIVASMLRVENEASKIKARATGHEPNSLEDDFDIAFQAFSDFKKKQRADHTLERARRAEKKVLREFDPREGMEERHNQVKLKREQRLAKNNIDKELESLRAQRKQIEDDIFVDPKDLQAMKLAVKKEAEELRQLDLKRKQQLKEQREKTLLEEQRLKLAKQKEEAETEFLKFKIERLCSRITDVWETSTWKSLNFSLKSLSAYSVNLRTKEMKVIRRRRFKITNSLMSAWKKFVKDILIEREAERFKQEQIKLEKLEAVASEFYTDKLYRNSWTEWIRFIDDTRKEKARENELNAKKEQVNRLFEFVKMRGLEEQRRNEEEAKAREKLEKKQRKKELMRMQILEEERIKLEMRARNEELRVRELVRHGEYSDEMTYTNSEAISSSRYDESAKHSYRYEEESDYYHDQIPSNRHFDTEASYRNENSYRKNERVHSNRTNEPSDSYQSEEQPQRSETMERAKHSPSPKKEVKPPPKEVIQMQQRQEERKQKREALKKVYEDKKAMEEQKKKELEEKQIQEEKQRKREALQKKKEEQKLKEEREQRVKLALEQLQEKINMANNHYLARVKSFTFKRWNLYLTLLYSSREKAEYMHKVSIQRVIWPYFKEAVGISKQETKQKLKVRLNWAHAYYLKNLKKRSFNCIRKEGLFNLEIQDGMYQSYLLGVAKLCLENWAAFVPQLKLERFEALRQENRIAKEFRFRFFAPRVLRSWARAVEEEKEAKMKEYHTNLIWEKVQGWLND